MPCERSPKGSEDQDPRQPLSLFLVGTKIPVLNWVHYIFQNYDRQILMDRNLGNVQAFSTATGLLNFRQIPVSTSPKNVPRPIRTSRVQSYLTVPEYNMSPTVSPSNYSAFSSRNCLVPRMTPSPSSGAGIGQNCLSKRTSSPFENRQVCTSQCCGNVTNSSNYQVGHSGNIVGSRQISSLGILRDNRWSNENSSMRSNQTSRLSASSGNSACVMWSGNLPARTIQGTAYSRKVCPDIFMSENGPSFRTIGDLVMFFLRINK